MALFHRIEAGTVIVAVKTASDIIVGADSKVHFPFVPGKTETTCKIEQAGRIFFAAAGVPRSLRFGYDAYQIARRSIQEGGSILEMLERFQDSVGTPLLDTMSFLHDNDPELYKKETGTAPALSMAFFGMENNVPIMAYSQFVVSFSGDQETVRVCNSTLGIDDYFIWGPTPRIKEFLDRNPGYFMKVGDAQAIIDLIQLAIEDRPDEVGEPIAIIRVNKLGAEWIHPSPCCPPIESH